jgi:hypothetical protein
MKIVVLFIRFGDLAAVTMALKPRSEAKISQIFGGTYCLHLHSLRVNIASMKEEAVSRASFLLNYLLDLLFDPKNGGNLFLRNVGELLSDYIASDI